MSSKELMAVADKFYEGLQAFLTRGESEQLDEVISPRALGLGLNVDHVMRGIGAMQAGLEGVEIEVEDMFTSGNRVCTLVSVTARKGKEFLDEGASGDELHVSEVHILDIENGRVKSVHVQASERRRDSD